MHAANRGVVLFLLRSLLGLLFLAMATPSAHAQSDGMNLSSAIVYSSPADIASWPITTTITRLEFQNPNGGGSAPGVSLTFSAQNTWPNYTPPGWNGTLQYTVWAVVKINGQWYTAGFIQMWKGRPSTNAGIIVNNDFSKNWAYDSRWGPMAGYQPVVGEQVGFFVSAGNARGTTGVTSVRERSNVVVVSLPANDTGVFTYSANLLTRQPYVLWQNDATQQAAIWYMTGSGGTVIKSQGWVSSGGVPGWHVGATGDLNGDGTPDLVWVNDSTRQVVVWFMTGPLGNVVQSSAWLSTTGYPGWHVVGMDDFNGDGTPDLVAQNDTTRQVMVVYIGGAQGTTVLGTNSLTTSDMPGWSVVGVRDFNGDGKPDLVWQNDTTRQVSVWFMGGAQGNVLQNSTWISSTGVPGWTVVGARDFNGDGKPDLVWQNDATRQVAVWYMGGALGNTMLGGGWISASGVPGWSVITR